MEVGEAKSRIWVWAAAREASETASGREGKGTYVVGGIYWAGKFGRGGSNRIMAASGADMHDGTGMVCRLAGDSNKVRMLVMMMMMMMNWMGEEREQKKIRASSYH